MNHLKETLKKINWLNIAQLVVVFAFVAIPLALPHFAGAGITLGSNETKPSDNNENN